MARSMGVRPSEVYRIKDEFVAYAFDSAVTRWGVAFEAAVQEAGSDAKDAKAARSAQERTIRAWLPSQRQYADPSRR